MVAEGVPIRNPTFPSKPPEPSAVGFKTGATTACRRRASGFKHRGLFRHLAMFRLKTF